MKLISKALRMLSQNRTPRARANLIAFAKRGAPVTPLLLPDAPSVPDLPIFLAEMTWVDFRCSDPDPLMQLIWGVTGTRPDIEGHSAK
jgi:hypothetical protein